MTFQTGQTKWDGGSTFFEKALLDGSIRTLTSSFERWNDKVEESTTLIEIAITSSSKRWNDNNKNK